MANRMSINTAVLVSCDACGSGELGVDEILCESCKAKVRNRKSVRSIRAARGFADARFEPLACEAGYPTYREAE